MGTLIREKPHRLAPSLYRGNRTAAFTCCIDQRKPYFTSEQHVRPIEALLLLSLKNHHTDAHIYLFMPDHLHLLLQGKDDAADLYACMVDFKQRSGFWFARNAEVCWQKDFYDHILRKDEEIKKQVDYILRNPVRKSIIADWRSYPYKGSTVYNFNEW